MADPFLLQNFAAEHTAAADPHVRAAGGERAPHEGPRGQVDRLAALDRVVRTDVVDTGTKEMHARAFGRHVLLGRVGEDEERMLVAVPAVDPEKIVAGMLFGEREFHLHATVGRHGRGVARPLRQEFHLLRLDAGGANRQVHLPAGRERDPVVVGGHGFVGPGTAVLVGQVFPTVLPPEDERRIAVGGGHLIEGRPVAFVWAGAERNQFAGLQGR